MSTAKKHASFAYLSQTILQSVATFLIVATAVILAGATLLAALGVLPWVTVPAAVGTHQLDVGPYLQMAFALMALLMLATVPGTVRLLRLETSHRDFQIAMDDVAEAYWAAHAADREGVFQLNREFDAVRERIAFLSQHPDLGAHDPRLLELAAQMSTEARELAEIYSDEKVEHARSMILERNAEVARLTKLIEQAHAVTHDLRRDLGSLEIAEDIVRSRLAALSEDVAELWNAFDEQARTTPPATIPFRIAGE